MKLTNWIREAFRLKKVLVSCFIENINGYSRDAIPVFKRKKLL